MHSFEFIDGEKLARFDHDGFQRAHSFPWEAMQGFLKPDAFEDLLASFPPLSFFEHHHDLPRPGGQRPHNRYYLAYQRSGYWHEDGEGVAVGDADLPANWRRFIAELNGEAYRDFARRAYGIDKLHLRFAWHLGHRGSEVSAHRDGESKRGTQIFYFNTRSDWEADWGGAILALEHLRTESVAPEFGDFATVTSSPITDNRSFIFRNTESAWHGVAPLGCPEGHHRRLFNVIAEEAAPAQALGTLPGQLARRAGAGLRALARRSLAAAGLRSS